MAYSEAGNAADAGDEDRSRIGPVTVPIGE
jgi:hypothetical protein